MRFEVSGSESIGEEKRKGPETIRDRLIDLLGSMAREVNSEYNANGGEGSLIDNKGRVDLNAFKNQLTAKEVDDDLQDVRDNEKYFAGTDNENRVDYYKEKYSLLETDEETIIQAWERESEELKAGQIEMLITLLLHHNIGSKFLVVRSSKYDDYENGVDNLIIDRNTGEVICAFDEVVNSIGSGRVDSKKEKNLKKFRSGGGKVKYGITFRDGKIALQSQANLPLFYLSLTTREIDEMLGDIQRGKSFSDDKMKKVIAKLMDSLLEQVRVLESIGLSKGLIGEKINRVKDMAKSIKGLVTIENLQV